MLCIFVAPTEVHRNENDLVEPKNCVTAVQSWQKDGREHVSPSAGSLSGLRAPLVCAPLYLIRFVMIVPNNGFVLVAWFVDCGHRALGVPFQRAGPGVLARLEPRERLGPGERKPSQPKGVCFIVHVWRVCAHLLLLWVGGVRCS